MQTRTIPFMPENPKYAFAYVPFQQYGNLYQTNNALYKGTIFKDLYYPFSAYENIPMMSPFK